MARPELVEALTPLSKPTITSEQAAACRLSFEHYLFWCHDITIRDHQKPMLYALQALADGNLRNPEASKDCDLCTEFVGCSSDHTTNKLLIEAFPGSGKTTLVTRWCAWMLGRLIVLEGRIPQAGMVSYAEDVAELRSVAIRDTFVGGKEEHRLLVFPETNPTDPDREVRPWYQKGWGQKEWFLWRKDATKEFPTMRAAGMTGSVLSYRFPSFLVVDDPTDPTELGGTRLEKDWTTWRRVIKTRTVQGITPIVMIGTRWAGDDLPGRVKSVEKDWFVVWCPAFDEETEKTRWAPEISNLDGEPMGISTEELLKAKREDPIGFETQYMARPPSAQGDIFTDLVEGYQPKLGDIRNIIQFWDTATTQKTKNSFNAMVEFWKLRNGKTFVNRVINAKERIGKIVTMMQDSYYETKEEVGEEVPVLVCIENKHAGPVYGEFVSFTLPVPVKMVDIPRKNLKGRATGQRAKGDAVGRAATIVSHVNAGTVFFPYDWKPWKEETYQQLMGFPNIPYDDIVAAFIGGVEYLYPVMRAGRPPRRMNIVRG